jgi:hypothetical protein
MMALPQDLDDQGWVLDAARRQVAETAPDLDLTTALTAGPAAAALVTASRDGRHTRRRGEWPRRRRQRPAGIDLTQGRRTRRTAPSWSSGAPHTPHNDGPHRRRRLRRFGPLDGCPRVRLRPQPRSAAYRSTWSHPGSRTCCRRTSARASPRRLARRRRLTRRRSPFRPPPRGAGSTPPSRSASTSRPTLLLLGGHAGRE